MLQTAIDMEVHIDLDLLLPDIYCRFNPIMCENIPLDESQNEKLKLEGLRYIKKKKNLNKEKKKMAEE